jgi:DNA-directed RNA polymerase sigma subunit (sigma70/sigma32)
MAKVSKTEVKEWIHEKDQRMLLGCAMMFRSLGLGDVLLSLDDKRLEIMLFRYGFIDGKTHSFRETGREFKYTGERVRQLEEKMFTKMRATMAKEYLKIAEKTLHNFIETLDI